MTTTAETRATNLQKTLRGLPEEELRLALVLNGGVSLAVWMGGVAHEINRLARSVADTSGTYAPILEAARATATVDVIAGTSAGGINGAALALAQANRGADLSSLRTLWAEQGRMEELLRPPFRGKPTSLLRGDDYFLPELSRAMKLLTEPFIPPTTPPPLHLILTTTLLTGVEKITIDEFGEKIPQRIHDGTFRFSNVADEEGRPVEEEDDPFCKEHLKATAKALALAARCTASFPFAFEPSFVPVGNVSNGTTPHDPREDDLRPNMQRFASWRDAQGSDQSRFAVDGGVLANTPIQHAVNAIHLRPATGPTRRAMLLVFPHAPEAQTIPADHQGNAPTASGALAGVFGALQAQGSRNYVESIDEHNRRVAAWDGGRKQLLAGLGNADTTPASDLYQLLTAAWTHYQYVRMQQATQTLVDSVAPTEQWPYSRALEAAQQAQNVWITPERTLPYVPGSFLPEDPAWRATHLAASGGWHWGDSAAIGAIGGIAEVLRCALDVAKDSEREALSRARTAVETCAQVVRTTRIELDDLWRDNKELSALPPDTEYWTARIAAYATAMQTALPDPAAEETPEAVGTKELARHLAKALRSPAARSNPGEPMPDSVVEVATDASETFAAEATGLGNTIAQQVRAAVNQLDDCRTLILKIANERRGAEAVSGLAPWSRFLFTQNGDRAVDAEEITLRLLALDCATRLITGGTPTGANQNIRLSELSLRVEHPWAHFSTSPDDKAAGLELNRFGGFLKRSWRINDWIWGRLDAATALCQVVLDPRRLRRMSATIAASARRKPTPEEIAETIMATLRQGLYGEDVQLPSPYDTLEDEAFEELKEAIDLDKGYPALHLKKLARWAALPLQTEAILEELPALRAAIELDVEDGAGRPTRGTRFLVERFDLITRVEQAGRATGPLDQHRFDLGFEALQAFDAAGIGREPLGEETGSNALIRTVSNAAGVMATVLDTDVGRIPAAKPVTGAVRGALMLPYWLVVGLAGGGRIARFLGTAGLVIGALFLVLSLFGVLGSLAAAAGLIGAACILAALGYAALKTGSLLHACALLTPVAPLVAYALDETEHQDAGIRVLAVVIAVAALYFLANIPWPMISPFAWAKAKKRRIQGRLEERWFPAFEAAWVARNTRRQVLDALLAAVVVVGVAMMFHYADPVTTAWNWFSGLLVDHVWAQVAGIVVVGAAGAGLAYYQGCLLRTWRRDGNDPVTYVRGDRRVAGPFVREDVRNPAGVAANWAPVYGIGYLVFAVLCWHAFQKLRDSPADWQVFTVWWLATIGVLLCVVAPVWVANHPRRHVRRLIGKYWPQMWAQAADFPDETDGAERLPEDKDIALRFPQRRNSEQLLLFTLFKYDATFRYLITDQPPKDSTAPLAPEEAEPGEPGAADPPPPTPAPATQTTRGKKDEEGRYRAGHVRLTYRGRNLLEVIERDRELARKKLREPTAPKY